MVSTLLQNNPQIMQIYIVFSVSRNTLQPEQQEAGLECKILAFDKKRSRRFIRNM